jgi:hypothetical protein
MKKPKRKKGKGAPKMKPEHKRRSISKKEAQDALT